MPELPEVETVKNALKNLISKKVARIDKFRDNLRFDIPDLHFLKNKEILDVHRRSKYLFISFEEGDIIVHLGMSGFLHWSKENRNKHDHWEMELEDGAILRLRDHRRFGAVLWQPKGTVLPIFSKLGPEPLTDDFTKDVLKENIKNKKSAIKKVIMDSSVVVGVGNIYASEALFHSNINPKTLANSLKDKEIEKLTNSIKFVLSEGIRLGGATLRDYHNVDGEDGLFAKFTHVYGRNGEKCKLCDTIIKSETIAQRNTFWCPSCQKEKKQKKGKK